MKKVLLKTAVLTLVTAITITSVAIVPKAEQKYYQVVYVDANRGNDNGSGSSSSPFKTLYAAQEYIRKINKNMTGDIFVDIAPGEYYLEETLAFQKADSGQNGYDVIWGTSSDEKPILSGGKHVKGQWMVEDAEKNIYSIPYEGPEYVRQIYVNGVRATRAATNGEFEFITEENSVKTETGYTTTNTEMLNWRNFTDIEFLYIANWLNPSCAAFNAEMLDDGKMAINMDPGLWPVIAFYRDNGQAQYPWKIENAYELMDLPGEFYYDRQLKKLYYIPRDGEDMATADVVVPYTEKLMTLDGKVDERIEHIVFQNLQFSYSAWYFPDHNRGWLDDQNSIVFAKRVPMDSTIYIEYADFIDFYDCEISHIGSAAMTFLRGVHDVDFIGNHIYDISGAGVYFGGIAGNGDPNEPGEMHNGDLRHDIYNFEIRNNWIHLTGRQYRGVSCITLGYVSDVNVIHNDLGDNPYTGIHVNWGWDGKNVVGNPATNIRIEENYIYKTLHGSRLVDGGAIYTLGSTGGSLDNPNTLARNYIRQEGRTNGAGGIYTDNGSSHWMIKENVLDFYDAYRDYWEYHWQNISPLAYHISLRDNYSTHNGFSQSLEKVNNNTESGTVNVRDCQWTDEAKEIIRNSGIEPEYRAKLGGAKKKGFEKLIIHTNQEKYIEDGSYKGTTMCLDVGETRSFTYTAQNSYAEEIPKSDYKVEFKSLTPDIIDVTGNSVTAKKLGIGYMEFTVTLNDGEKQVRTVNVVCGDELSRVNIQNKTTNMYLGAETELGIECYSALGNAITDFDVTFSSSNPDVATINAQGLVNALSLGNTVITVTATSNGKTVSETLGIEVTEIQKADTSEFKVTDLTDIISDVNGWESYFGANTIRTAKGGSLQIETPAAYTVYKKRTFENELLNFNVTIEGPDDGWPTIVIGQKYPTMSAIANDQDSYLIVVMPHAIEVQRFNVRKDRTMFYGVLWDRLQGVYGDLPNTFWEYGKEVNVQLGKFDQPDGTVRLVMNVDGKNIFDIIDNVPGQHQGPMYFGIINNDGITTLARPKGKAAETESEESAEGSSKTFEDIAGHWANVSINKLHNAGFVSGVSKTHFSPNSTISRAEFIAMVTRVIGASPEDGDAYKDVPSWAWYAKYINAALKLGIIDSHFVENGNINPNAPIRRDEMASLLVMAYKYCLSDYPEIADITTFRDFEAIEPWSTAYMKTAVGGKLVLGDDTNALNPLGIATRAEAAEMMVRLATLIEAL